MNTDKVNSILIVDDRKENIDALRTILEDTYIVYIALDGERALKIIEKVEPDLILLDVAMPNMDGFEVHAEMKKRGYNMPVIFITAKNDDVFSEVKGLSLGAVDYIVKPYNPDIVCIKAQNQIKNKLYRDSLEHLVEQQTKELRSSREAIIMGMSLLAEGRDQGTGEHIKRMQQYTAILAKELLASHPELISETEVENIILLSPLHDIGKVFISDSILMKNGKLTFEEFEKMKEHAVFGADVLKKTETYLHGDTDILQIAVEIAECHHEKYDGTGYPHGLKGNEIPISARIVMLADIYDALTSKREYKDKFSHDKAMDIIMNGDGRTEPSHFDPVVLDVFVRSSPLFNKVF